MQKNILMVDDDVKTVERRKMVLERAGYKVTACYDGGEAIESLRKEKFDLVLLDLEMPKMGGNEVLKIIREDPQLRETKVLVVTALSGSIQERAEEIGLTHRGWAGRFDIAEKWAKDGSSEVYPGHRVDRLTASSLLHKVEQMFRFYEEIDRPKQPGEPDRILIAEDQRASVEKIESILKEKGFPVFYAADGEDALKILGEQDIDLVLLDLDMPKLKGDELLKIMSENYVLSTIPVIILTGVVDYGKADKSLRKKIEDKYYGLTVFEKPRKRWFFAPKDNTYDVIKSVEDLINERKLLGLGYKKDKMSFIRNKNYKYLPGCIEAYQPAGAEDNPAQYGSTKFYCAYCEKEKHVDLIACSYKLVSPPRTEKIWQLSSFGGTVYICLDCAEELVKKYPNFAKWWQERSIMTLLENIKQNRDYAIELKEERSKDISEKVILMLKDFLLETGRFKYEMDIEITPDSKFDEDLSFDLSDDAGIDAIRFWLDLQDKFSIEIPPDLLEEEKEMAIYDSLKTVQNLVDYVEKKVKEQHG